MGPAFTAFRQSLPTEKSLPVRPKLRPILLPRTRLSRNKNIDVLVAYHRGKIHFMRTPLRAEVVMLFAVERLSERSEDWPTNGTD